MVGQGRPHASPIFRARAAHPWRGSLRLHALACCFVVAAAAWPETAIAQPNVRLRVEWGGGKPVQWRGRLSVSRGAAWQPQTLGIEADSAVELTLHEGRLDIEPRSPRTYDGFDVTVAAPLDAVVRFDLSRDDDGGAPQAIELPLRDLLTEPHHAALDDQGNRLVIRRAPGDALRVKLAGDSLVFSPGEQLKLDCQPHLLPVDAGDRLTLACMLTRAADGRTVWDDEQDFTAPDADAAPLDLPVRCTIPAIEGVYDLTLTAQRSGLGRGLRLKRAVAERHVQLAVVARRAVERDLSEGQPPADVVFELDPTQSDWRQRLKKLPLLSSFAKGPVGSGDSTVRHGAGGDLLQLGNDSQQPLIGWEAFPLLALRPGQPHVLEVEYAADVPQSLGVSVLEPNAAGELTPIGLDSGVYVESPQSEGSRGVHRVVFWPRTRTPLALLTDRGSRAPAVVGKIRVLGVKPRQPLALSRDARFGYLPPASGGSAAPQRLLAGYFDRPLFAENFLAPDALDVATGRSLKDWRTFHVGGLRLVEYLKHAGYNGAMLAALADGSAIYPSELAAPTPRHDTGAFFSTGQDPVRKDVLELLFRLFDREGLRLIPSLQFAAPLPALEGLKAGQPDSAEGIDLLDAEGQPWTAYYAPRQGLAPYYNVLDPRVQDILLDLVRETLERYREHPSFAGLAIQLTADGYSQFPGVEWGCDSATFARFMDDTGIDAVALGDRNRPSSARNLAEPAVRERWLAWRASEVARFYERVSVEVAKSKPDARLYLAGANMLQGPEFERFLRPRVQGAASFDEAMLAAGISPAAYRSMSRVVLLRPQRLAPPDAPRQPLYQALNESAEVDAEFLGEQFSGSLFFHEPQEARLPEFDAHSPYRRSLTRLVTQASPSGWHNRRRFAHALATLDSQAIFDGGWLLPLGQEAAWGDLGALYRDLPDSPFGQVADVPQPLTVRMLSWQDRTYVYVVNDSPWSTQAALSLRIPPNCTAKALGVAADLPSPAQPGGESEWVIDLDPYDAAGIVFDNPGASVTAVRATVEERATQELSQRVSDLIDRVAVLTESPPAWKSLDDTGFENEPPAGQAFDGWEAFEEWGLSARRDAEGPQAGAHCMHLSVVDGRGYLRSNPLPTPRTGRLTATFWLRTDDVASQPPMRVAVTGRQAGQEFYEFETLGKAAVKKWRLGEEWRKFEVSFSNLPLDGWETLRLRFDLLGPGDVWIDDVVLRDLVLAKDQQEEWRFTVSMAALHLKQGDIVDCQRLLDGYWPRLLEANVEVPAAAVARRSRPTNSQPPPLKEDGPDFFDRLRKVLPAFLR